MTKRDVLWRLAGVAALAGAGGISLLHRELLAEHLSRPATSMEWVLGLLSFLLASFGALLIINGARLREDWVRACDREHGSDDLHADERDAASAEPQRQTRRAVPRSSDARPATVTRPFQRQPTR